MLFSATLILLVAGWVLPTAANVEKIIFKAPENPPSLQNIQLETKNLDILSPLNPVLRTHLPASFPSLDQTHGTDTWLLLEDLSQHKRYELRVCWAATQPTAFTIRLHTVSEVLRNSTLLNSLVLSKKSSRPTTDPKSRFDSPPRAGLDASPSLIIQILAAADYISFNQTLMQNVPHVKVDLILDQYYLGVLPYSLYGIVIYIILLTIVAATLISMPHSTYEEEMQVSATRRTPEERCIARQQLRNLYALPLYRLPAELVLKILGLLDLEDYPSFIVAAMPLLRRCGIVDHIDTPRLRRLLTEPRRGFYTSFASVTDPLSDGYISPAFRRFILHHLSPRNEASRKSTTMPLRLQSELDRLPPELQWIIFWHLSPVDKVNLVLACFRFSDEDIERLTHEKISLISQT